MKTTNNSTAIVQIESGTQMILIGELNEMSEKDLKTLSLQQQECREFITSARIIYNEEFKETLISDADKTINAISERLE